MTSNNKPVELTIDAIPPFTFGIGLKGELIIGYGLKQTGDLARYHLVIPAEEVKILRLGLEQSMGIQETLAAVPPTQSKH